MKLTPDDVLGLTESLIDAIGEKTNRGFTESEEAHLAIDVWNWLQRFAPEVTEE